MKQVVRRARPHVMAVGVTLALVTPSVASARKLVFVETWENGTSAWRTQMANGGDCKGWPECGQSIRVRDHDGANGRDVNTCSGKYINVPRAYAGWDSGNVNVTGGVVQAGNTFHNAQFPVVLGDRLCIVAWVRAWDEGGNGAGPYVGINYTGAHGVVDAGHDHCTHYMIGPPVWVGGVLTPQGDPEAGCTWRTTGRQPPYGTMTPVITDGLWHRYKNAFQVNAGDVIDWRIWSPELPANTSWNNDGLLYGQPRLLLFGKPPERADVPAGTPPIVHDADFGDVLVFKAEDAGENACPTDAELDALPWASDHAACEGGRICTTRVAALPAGDRTPARPGNTANLCIGCTAAFGAAPPGQGVCTETSPFCVGADGLRGGTCQPCGGDATSGADPTTKCAADKPTCFTEGASFGACGKCVDNTSCSAPAHPGPNCDVTSGACFACAADWGSGQPNACPETAPRCDPFTKLCVKCAWNDECSGPDHPGPLCHVATGQCTTCASDFGAPGGPTTCLADFPLCLTAPMNGEPVGVCGRCTSSADCVNPAGKTTHHGTMCDPGTGACGKCDGDRGVSWTHYGCIEEATPTCRPDGACGKCTSDADCTNPTGKKIHAFSRCNVATGVCEGPPADVPKCDGDMGTSTTANACADPAAAVCRPDGMCTKCVSDADCLNPPGVKLHARSVCDLATGSCSQGGEAEVPAAVGNEPWVGDGCICSSLPARNGRAAFGAAGVALAAVLLGLRRARRQGRSS